MSLAMLVFWGILAWAVVNIVRHNNAHSNGKSQPPPGTGSSDVLRILDERLARGEIETDEYTRRRDLLKRSGPAGGPG
jgi:putative membrane protein